MKDIKRYAGMVEIVTLSGIKGLLPEMQKEYLELHKRFKNYDVPAEVITSIDELHAFACQSPDTTPNIILKITKVIENYLGIRMEEK